jgi:23S rRNA (guanosine2251-2'-O)-methyltransferase
LVVSGVNGVLELLRSGATVERLLLGDGPRRAELLVEGRRRGLVAVDADRATLDRLAGRPGHQGAVAVAAPFRYASLETIAESRSPLLLVLDNVQDPRNLGALLRTARAAGAGGVILPRDRSVGVTSVVAVASAGTLFGLPIVRVPNLVRAMNSLKAFGFWLVGLVPSSPRSLFELDAPDRIALVVGSEGSGLRQLVQRTCDLEVAIPMAPGVESLNVSVAAGVALFELRRRLPQVR